MKLKLIQGDCIEVFKDILKGVLAEGKRTVCGNKSSVLWVEGLWS